MTQDEIIQSAKKGWEQGSGFNVPFPEGLLRICMQSAVKNERKECANICDKNAQKALSAQKVIDSDDLSDVFLRHHASAHFQSAEAIRARQ